MAKVTHRPSGSSHGGRTSDDRFLERTKEYARGAVDRSLANGKMTDIGKGGIDVVVPKRDLKEPFLHHGQGGRNQRVLPGNKEYNAGDGIPRPQGGGGGKGSQASEDGEGSDDFIFHLSEQEFLKLLFEGLELPNLTKAKADDVSKVKWKRNGISTEGPVNRLDLVRSLRAKKGRLMAAYKKHDDRILELMEEERSILLAHTDGEAVPATKSQWKPVAIRIRDMERELDTLREKFAVHALSNETLRLAEINQEIEEITGQKRRVPRWYPEADLRYHSIKPIPLPMSKAVMFCLMDVSGSMDEGTKTNAKIFYFLLFRFLKRHYEKVDVVFLRHHTTAEEVNEHDFFYKPETGGTKVSTVLEKMLEVLADRYPEEEWNIYGAQASDGDNIDSDNPTCKKLLAQILEKAQGYFYTEITKSQHQNLWRTYEAMRPAYQDRFWLGHIKDRSDIWPVFREFFQKRDTSANRLAAFAPTLS